MLFVILTVKKLLERFTKNDCKRHVKQNRKRIEKVIKRKSDKLYVK